MFRRSTVQASRAFTRLNHRLAYEPNPEKAKAFIENIKHTQEHNKKSSGLWRNISLATIPIIAWCAYVTYGKEAHHVHHIEELNNIPDDEWPKEFEYQNIRSKKFPWGDGDKSLFWSWTNKHRE